MTLREYAESFVRNPKSTTEQILKLKKLAEEMGDYSAPEGDSGDQVDPGQGVHDAFLTAAMHICSAALKGEMDHGEASKKLKKLMSTHKDVNGPADEPEGDGGEDKGESKDGDGDGKAGEGDSEKKESAQRGPDYPALLSECAEMGFKPSALELRALTAFATAAERKQYIAEQRQKEPGDTVKAAGRKPGSSTAGSAKLAEQTQDTKPVPTDGKTFAESVRG